MDIFGNWEVFQGSSWDPENEVGSCFLARGEEAAASSKSSASLGGGGIG